MDRILPNEVVGDDKRGIELWWTLLREDALVFVATLSLGRISNQ